MNQPEAILDYLRQRLPGYPFDLELDAPFVDELLEDFNHVDILEQTKAFRWYHDNQPTQKHKNLRVALRRWLSRSRPPIAS